MGILIAAFPLELIITVPNNAPPVTSAALTPESVYSTDVPAATFVVDKVNVAVEPSLTEELPWVRA